jgi:hypothetical protein
MKSEEPIFQEDNWLNPTASELGHGRDGPPVALRVGGLGWDALKDHDRWIA